MASTQRVIKTRWGVNLNEVTLYEGNIPAAVTYTVTSWVEAGRHPGRAANQIRSRRQPDHCAGDRAHPASERCRPRE
jgi:hypothetical protein